MSDVSYVDVIFVLVTGFIAYHGITYRDKNDEKPWLHLFFGCIAALYCLWVLGRDILHLF